VRALLFALVLAMGGARAQPVVHIVVPFAAGGVQDIVARSFNAELGALLGRNVIVENRAGAGGTIGTDIVAKAKPDGYTLLVGSMGVAVNAVLYPKLPYDTLKDLAPITMLAEQPNIVVVHPSLPVKSIRELLALAKAQPGQITYGSGGVGSNSHFATVLFLMSAKIDLLHVPYKGTAPAMTDLLGGQVELMFDNLITAMAHVKSGKLRLLGVAGERRIGAFADVPAINEVLPGFRSETWMALVAPPGTPTAITDKLSAAVRRAVAEPDFRRLLSELQAEPVGNTPREMAEVIRQESKRWSRVIREARITIE